MAMALLVAGPALAYKVFLRDGTTRTTVDEYRVEGDRAILALTNGTRLSLPLDEIDVERTEEYNATSNQVLDDAVLIDRNGSRKLDLDEIGRRTPTTRAVDLSEQLRRARDTTAEQREGRSIELPPTAGGFPDLASMPRNDPDDAALQRWVEEELATQGLENFSVYSGTTDRRLFLEVTADSRGAVLRALEQISRVAADLGRAPGDVAHLEVLIRSSNRSRAGQFVIDAATASRLADGAVTAGEFFVANVQF